MASKTTFQSYRGKLLPRTDAVNRARGPAYGLPPRAALAQYAATGCLDGTFYADGEAQVDAVLSLCSKLEPEFVAKAALHAREKGFMKDMPALLAAVLASSAPAVLARIFDRLIDDARMLRTFVQIVRSGVTGRKSLGSAPKRLVRRWFEARDEAAVFRASVGNDPSLADVIRMARPRPATAARSALYAYLVERPYDATALPALVRAFELYKAARAGGEAAALAPPDVPFQMLTALDLGPAEWTAIARRASWQMTRMNLNTFARQGVFAQEGMTELIAARLRDPAAIERARAFPYQLLAAYRASGQAMLRASGRTAGEPVPGAVREALSEAVEVAAKNVPAVEGKVYVFPDVSGSMSTPVTGRREGATTAVRCIDVAALLSAAIVRKNPDATVVPFDTTAKEFVVNPWEGIFDMADRLARYGGGGTACSAPLAALNARGATGDLVIYVSDNESWVDARRGGATSTMREWAEFRRRSPEARLVCIDIQPGATTQAACRPEILNVGGFSDEVFRVVADFARGGGDDGDEAWVRAVEEVSI